MVSIIAGFGVIVNEHFFDKRTLKLRDLYSVLNRSFYPVSQEEDPASGAWYNLLGNFITTI